MCLEAGRGVGGLIGVTQPRRIAALTVARRIAEELGEPLGRSVGYKIRFQDTHPGGRLRQGHDRRDPPGRDGQGDRMLSAYDTLIVDEAHERNLNIDFILGYPAHARRTGGATCGWSSPRPRSTRTSSRGPSTTRP